MFRSNKGISVFRMFSVLIAFFTLSVIFMGFDNFVGNQLPTQMKQVMQVAAGSPAAEGVDDYVRGWDLMVPLFAISFLIYIIIAGLSPKDTRNI